MTRTIQVIIGLTALMLTISTFSMAELVPDTGQTQCYDNLEPEIPCPQPGEPYYGQDGSYSINLPSYTKLGASANPLPYTAAEWVMVKDEVTGLIWEKKTKDGSDHHWTNKYTWYDSNPATNGGDAGTPGDGETTFDTEYFIEALNEDHFGGFSDWRLPTIKELASIVDYGEFIPSINVAYFPNMPHSANHWSSTTRSGFPSSAWKVYFSTGSEGLSAKSSDYYVRAVRGDPMINLFVNNGDGTVTDEASGLMWERKTDDGGDNDKDNTYSWVQALGWVADLNDAAYLGYRDWRLPNVRELRSIVDYGKNGPSIDEVYFPRTVSTQYWSSTTYAAATDSAWLVDFNDGRDILLSKTDFMRAVRAVRGGQNELPGYLLISTPTQASTWTENDIMPITWDPEGVTGDVKISFSLEGGKEGTFQIISEATANDGHHDWEIMGPPSVNAFLKIESVDEPSKKTTQGLFTIVRVDPGDIDGNGRIDLTDAILALKIISGMRPEAKYYKGADVDGDGKIGLGEVIFIIQTVANRR